MSRMVTEAMVEALLSRFGMADFRKGSRAIGHDGPEKDRWEDYLEVPVDVLGRIEAALSVPAAEQKAEPVARKRFPILKGDGATIDWQLVEDHGGQAQQNHYQTVQRLAERGGLSWSELHAVLHNQRYRDMDANEAMLACRALEARYLAAIAPSTQAEQKAEPVAWRAKNDIGEWHYTTNKQLVITWTDFEKIDVEPLYATPSTQAIEARNAVIEALRPFAAEADRISPEWAGERRRSTLTDSKALTVGDFRRARAALRAAEARQL